MLNAYGNGTAYNGISAYAVTNTGSFNIPSSSSVSNLQKAVSNLGSSSSGTTKKVNKLQNALDALEKLFDWIEVRLDRIQRDINYDTALSENAVGYEQKNKHVTSAQFDTRALIDANEKAVVKYRNQADKTAKQVGLSKNLYNKIKSGKIEIESLSENDRNRVEAVKQWYDKMLDAQQATEDLKTSLKELAQTKMDNITNQFDAMLSGIEHQASMIDGFIEQSELEGYLESTKYYNALISNSESSISMMKQERAALEASLKESVSDGSIPLESVEWYEMQGQIDEVTKSIQDAENSVIEFNNKIRELNWDVFDKTQEAISRISDETSFLIDLMSMDDLFTDKGQVTEKGMATAGLHGVNYNTYMEQANQYRDEMLEIEKSIAEDPNNLILLERREELLDLQRDSIQAAEDEKQAIKDLVKEGIDKQLESLQDLIEKYKEALSSQKNLYDYQKNISEQTKEIETLRKRLAMAQGDDSEEGRLREQEIRNQLKEAEDNLRETEYDKFLSDQQEILDELYDEYSEVLNERLDNVDELVSNVIESVNENSKTIAETLVKEADAVGYDITDAMKQIWCNGSDTNILSAYSDNFSSTMTTVQGTIDNIKLGIDALVQAADKEASGDVTESTTNNANTSQVTAKNTPTTTTVTASNTNAVNTTVATSASSSGDGKPKVGDKVTFASGKYTATSGGSGASGNNRLGKEVYITKIASSGSRRYHISTGKKLGSGDLGWVKLKQLKGYASGTDYVNKDEWARVAENGREIITNPDGSITLADGSVLTPISRGSGVINNPNTERLLELANNYDAVKNMIDTVGVMSAGKQASALAEMERQLLNSQIVNNNGNNSDSVVHVNLSFSLPNVNSPEQFMNWFVSNKKAQRTMADVIAAPMNSKSSFSHKRNKY